MMRKSKVQTSAAPVVPITADELIESEIVVLSRYRTGAGKKAEIVADVRKVARRIRELAEDVERHAYRAEVDAGLVPVPDGLHAAGERLNDPSALDRIATDVQHDVLWAVANLSLDRLATSVQDYAANRRELEAHILARVLPAMAPFFRAHDAAQLTEQKEEVL